MTESYKPPPAGCANCSNTATRFLSSQDGADRQHVRPPVQETHLEDVDVSDDHLDLDGPTSFLGESYDFGQVLIEQPSTSTHKHVARDLDKGSDDRHGCYVAASMRHIPDDRPLSPLTTGIKAENARDSEDVNSPYRSIPENFTLTSRKTATAFHGQSASGFSSDGMNQPSGGHLQNVDSELRPSSKANSSEVNMENQDLRLAVLKSLIAHFDPLVSCTTAHDIFPTVKDLERKSDESLAAAMCHIDLDPPQSRLKTSVQTGTNQQSSEAIYPPRSSPRNLDNLQTNPIMTESFSPKQSTFGNSSDGMHQHSRSRLRNLDSGVKDHCRCFYCGNLLRDWKIDDDPETEHELWFPDCPFVLLMKSRTLNGNELFDHQTVDSINTGLTRPSFQGGDLALYPHIDPYICGVCGIREIGATQLYCMHIVMRMVNPGVEFAARKL